MTRFTQICTCGHLDIQHDSIGCYECEMKYYDSKFPYVVHHTFNADYKNPLNKEYQEPVFDYTQWGHTK